MPSCRRGTAGRRAALLVAAIAAAIAAPSSASAAPKDFVRLSDERTRTHSADVLRSVWVRKAPGGRRTRRLRTHTYHGSPEVVLALGVRSVGRRSWTYIRYSGLGSPRGWVPTGALSVTTIHTDRLVLERGSMRLKLYRGTKVLFNAPVGIGAPGSPTPGGRYYVRERLGPFGNPNGVYGALAFGISAYSPHRTYWAGGGQVGIHGTNQPSLIPGRISNGCVRLTNAKIRRLARMLRVGTPLLIR